jgi:hypothetical protein
MASLDIPERQVLIYFANDAISWHHRVLVVQVDGANWVVATPDFDIENVDLSDAFVRALARNSAFPQNLGQVYAFDNPITPESLAAIRSEGRRLAEVLGARAVAVPGAIAANEVQWRYADAAHDKFGEEVPTDTIADAARIKIGGNWALVDVDGNGDWTSAQRVSDGDVVVWLDEKRTGAGRDSRLGPTHRNADGARSTTLANAVQVMKREPVIAGWVFEGPSACVELAKGVVATGHELLAYAPHYIRISGLSPSSGLAIELTTLLSVLHFAFTRDLVNPYNLNCLEMVARRVLMIQKAVRRNAKAPDFDGLDVYMSHSFDSTGGIITQAFDRHIAGVQKDEAQILKQQRLWSEEQDTRKKKEKPPKGGGKGE